MMLTTGFLLPKKRRSTMCDRGIEELLVVPKHDSVFCFNSHKKK